MEQNFHRISIQNFRIEIWLISGTVRLPFSKISGRNSCTGWWARSGPSESRLSEKGDDARSRRGEKNEGGREREVERTERKGKEKKGKERKAVSSIPFQRKFVERESKSSRERARVSKRRRGWIHVNRCGIGSCPRGLWPRGLAKRRRERGGNERFRRTKVVKKERNQGETLCLGIFFSRRTDTFNGG